MKLTKTTCRYQVADEHLTRQIRESTTSVKSDIDTDTDL